MPTLSDFTARRIDGQNKPLADFAGKAALIVNVASKCGNTPQYAGLEALWERLGRRGLTILGFPCNQFAGQEPGTEAEIAEFCQLNYGVTFPLFGKIEVNGEGADPLYTWLKDETPGSDGRDIEWNFAKFLVGRDGRPIRRFGPKELPEAVAPEIEAAL
jgi:glutathione peroxidase